MKKIGLAVHNIHEEYSIELIRGVEKYCSENDLQLLLFPINAQKSENHGFEYRAQSIKNLLTPENVDALILSSGTLSSFITKEEFIEYVKTLSPLPVVSIGVDVPGVPTILSNSKKAFTNNIKHLIKKHHRKNFILLCASENNYDAVSRKQWFLETLESFKMYMDKTKIINADFNKIRAKNAINLYISKFGVDFDCIVCLNDGMAFGAIEALTEHGIRIPEDIIVTGFDNSKRARFSEPSLSTIDPQISLQSYMATQVACDLIDGKKTDEIYYVEATERFRVSCGCVKGRWLLSDSVDYYGRRHNFSKKSLYSLIHSVPNIVNTELYALHQLIQNSLAIVSLNELYRLISKYIDRTSLEAMAIFTYDKPKDYLPDTTSFKMPHKVKRVFVYEKLNDKNINTENKIFNPYKEAFPEDTFKHYYRKLVFYPLFESTYQYGYIIVPLENHDYLFYELILESFSKEITASIKLELEQEANTILENKNSRLIEYNTRMATLSTTDELTKINNRRGFTIEANKLLKAAKSKNRYGMILFCDMDGLKKINDTYGHEAGDRAIIAESKILQNISRKSDVIGRFGGDEFALAIEGMDKKSFKLLEQRIIEESNTYNKTSKEKFKVSISIGAAQYTPANNDLEKLLAIADKELYKVKAKKHKENK